MSIPSKSNSASFSEADIRSGTAQDVELKNCLEGN